MIEKVHHSVGDNSNHDLDEAELQTKHTLHGLSAAQRNQSVDISEESDKDKDKDR